MSDAGPTPLPDAGQLPPSPDSGTPGNAAPTAVIRPDRTSGEVPFSVELSAIASTDPDDAIVRFEWSFGDGTPASGQAVVSHTYGTPGLYVVTLTVWDAAANTGTAQVTLTATEPPPPPPMRHPPVAAATAQPTAGDAPLSVQLSAAGSTAPDNDIQSYVWTFGDGTSSETGRDVSHVYTQAGQYTARVIVTDATQQSTAADVAIAVTRRPNTNSPPVARGTVSTRSGIAPLRVTFSASGSSDPDGDIAGYAWDFGDGSPVDTRINAEHTYAQAGTFSVSLTVTEPSALMETWIRVQYPASASSILLSTTS